MPMSRTAAPSPLPPKATVFFMPAMAGGEAGSIWNAPPLGSSSVPPAQTSSRPVSPRLLTSGTTSVPPSTLVARATHSKTSGSVSSSCQPA